MQLGMIGLGRMGHPIATNVLAGGFSLVVFNRTREKESGLVADGATSAADPKSLAAAADVVLLCLSDPAAVRDVTLGPHGVAAGLRPGAILVDLSTVDAATNEACAAACAERGAGFLDAPVSGGVSRASDGTLTVMVGGDPRQFEIARPVLDSFSQNLVHVGGVGAGTTVKLINQLLMGVALAVAAEAYALSVRAGLDGETLHGILRTSSGASWALDRGMSRFLTGDYTPIFSVDLLVKDLELAARTGSDRDAPMSLTETALGMYREAQEAGRGAEDTTSVVKALLPTEEDMP